MPDMRALFALLAFPLLAFAAAPKPAYTPDVTITVPAGFGATVKVSPRATNASNSILVTVNKGSKVTIVETPPVTPPVVTPPVITPPVVVPPVTSSDFDARKSAPGVVRYFDFDAPIPIYDGGAPQNYKIDRGNLTTATLDTAVKASGASSLRFDVPSGPGSSNAAGAFTGNFSADLKTRFGENSEFFVQWRQRFNAAMVDTQITTNDGSPQGGIKMLGLEAGDYVAPTLPYGIRQYNACEAIGVLVQTYYQTRWPIAYNSCTGSASHGPYSGFGEVVHDTPGWELLQNGIPNQGCSYSASRAGCFKWVADEWMTFEVRVKTGPRVNGEFQNSEVQLWAARENKPPQLLINWRPGIGGYFPLTATDPNTGDEQSFGKVWLLPYMTATNETVAHPLMTTWYDELIISRQAIKFPGGFDPVVPGAPPVVTPPVVTPPPVTGNYPAWRQGKAVGQWFEIPNTAAMNGEIPWLWAGTVNAWNGFAAAPSAFWSGASSGHGEWWNPVLRFDFTADVPKWELVKASAAQSDVVRDAPYYKDGSPVARHSYYTTQWLDAKDSPDGKSRVMLYGSYAAFAIGSGAANEFGGGPQVDGFNVDAKAWDAAGAWPNMPLPATPYGYLTPFAVDPRTSEAWVAWGDDTIYKFAPKSKTWSTFTTTPGYPDNANRLLALVQQPTLIDVKRNAYVGIVDGQPYYTVFGLRIQRVDLATRAVTSVRVTGALTGVRGGGALVHDTDGDRYMYFEADGKVYSIHPDTGASELSATVIPPLADSENRAAYFPKLGGIGYYPRFDANMLFLPTR
jgi:hypothetical protein